MSRLDEVRAELAKTFGKTTRWQVLCRQNDATTDCEKIKVAEQVLAEPCTGTIAEAQGHWLELQGVESEPSPPYKPTGF